MKKISPLSEGNDCKDLVWHVCWSQSHMRKFNKKTRQRSYKVLYKIIWSIIHVHKICINSCCILYISILNKKVFVLLHLNIYIYKGKYWPNSFKISTKTTFVQHKHSVLTNTDKKKYLFLSNTCVFWVLFYFHFTGFQNTVVQIIFTLMYRKRNICIFL